MATSSWTSRRSSVVCKHGMVSSSQPLASQIGIDILKHGGNAADAAVAMAAALNVTEPCGTGIGGDAFCLFYDAETKTVKGLNGSGRSPAGLALEKVHSEGYQPSEKLPVGHGHTVTVPGAAAAWVDTVEKFGSGKLSLGDILSPAIRLAEEGFPVHGTASVFWEMGAHTLTGETNPHGGTMLLNGKPPRQGEIMKLPCLANTFRTLVAEGKTGFYSGRIAKAIVEAVDRAGGVLTVEDLEAHVTTFEDPISVDYQGVRVWEVPPNGQGITALMALNILEGFDLKDTKHNSTEYLHLLIESLRLSFADTLWYVTDPTVVDVPVKGMLSKEYAAERRKKISKNSCLSGCDRGSPMSSSDTVYLSVVDTEGNACSFINSNYMGFGTGLVPEGCGFTLQNRGWSFSLDPTHPNCLAPCKRPYHTIIPAMITDTKDGSLLASYGVMGGYMQPQGHVQVLLNMLEFGMDPQQALDQPRFCIGPGHQGASGTIQFEDGIDPRTLEELQVMGHDVHGPVKGLQKRALFGRGQVITKGAWWSQSDRIANEPGVWWGGGDPRADSLTIGY
ncbi:glutathione hydrolase-like YwrD proenzyme [Lineus longissimus]|uniref:glutathione hydrolase-like YwrD proenzyme n=1 Tax=Lineus longissimus TaxID=88925 RepID=UPI002B4D67D2